MHDSGFTFHEVIFPLMIFYLDCTLISPYCAARPGRASNFKRRTPLYSDLTNVITSMPKDPYPVRSSSLGSEQADTVGSTYRILSFWGQWRSA